MDYLIRPIEELVKNIDAIDSIDEKIEAINRIKLALHEISPFKLEPVDCVLWKKHELIEANDYNPNSVAPPEMELLRLSVSNDGYTQPVVTFPEGDKITVVDGFHRTRICKEFGDIQARVHGYLPTVSIRPSQTDRNNRMASTIRHNRARGKHAVDAMSEIVLELKNRNWTNERIAKELGMEADEVLRLVQITGLTEMFSDSEFSKSWDVEGSITVDDFEELSENPDDYEEEITKSRTVNTSDEARVFHTYDQWECYKAGFYATKFDGMTKAECEIAYRDFLSDSDKFAAALEVVTTQWVNSCEHYLTNSAMNRIAWLGQAAACQAMGIPSTFRSGFGLLTEEQQEKANSVALVYLNKWLKANGRDELTMDEAISYSRQSDIY